ncbi:3-phosphoshikimate 1-carboxyvinyltransferase [Alicyclobacillus cellulosilyticus]|uniref:3-phosphoshikimate 1-carboxyvinyltransferase n=1 Tax=Alicyclobacillus cellulosilyticus TaxID=1003997 RepID=A0A917NLR0_9BACL|nr:3-phosphoshikimate 1-carboxyvinyltransferase [Alicyclobacillus cellulosilyticus]GGJ07255.1 3-phosphoshikimate 1-carboxyvinyltransferase [Alicyclobacillus cellulosilyticus]
MTQPMDLSARSPWSRLNDVEEVEVHPLHRPVDADVVVPGSKSFTNRALIMAGLAHGRSVLHGILRSDDSYWCVDSLRRLGLRVHVDGDTVEVDGSGGEWPVQEAELFIGAAGTTARFLPGALAVAPRGCWRVTGNRRLSERPLAPLLDALTALGARIEATAGGCLPITVHGSGLRGGQLAMSGRQSSQFISGVLIAAPYAEQPVDIAITDHIVQHAYVHITIDVMRAFGAAVTADASLRTMHVTPGPYQGRTLQLEADASTACYFFAMAALVGGRMRVTNLGYHTRQPDIRFVDLLERMGCEVVRGETFVEVRGSGRLHGGLTVSMKEMSDQTLTLAALAPFADGPVTVTDVAHIRHHESDRIHAACTLLREMGIRAEERDDGFTVWPGDPRPARLATYDDHRIAMAFSLLGLRVPGIRVLDPGCVSKTCPVFFDRLQDLGVRVTYVQRDGAGG